MTFLNLSSNSPRYFAPATRSPMSSESSLLFLRLSGTSLDAILRASPSTMAVFPTPGSPMRTGLFFVLRLKTCITLRISSSLPITGSILSCRARIVRSTQYFSSTRILPSGSFESTLSFPRIDFNAVRTEDFTAPIFLSISPVLPSLSVMARNTCSVERYMSFNADISPSAFAITFCSSEEALIPLPAPLTLGSEFKILSISDSRFSFLMPIRSMRGAIIPSF